MARARNIKPNFFKNELLGVADPMLNLLFISLWTLADKSGRLEDRPLRIKAETFPYRENVDVNGYLTELQRLEFICRYEVDGSRFIQIINFEKHQAPHKTEKESVIPSMEKMTIKTDSCALTVKQPLRDGELTAALPPDLLIPDSLIPDCLNDESTKTSPPKSKAADVEFELMWVEYPKRPGANKAGTLKNWNARLKEGADPQAMIAGVKSYANYCRINHVEPNYIKQSTTFFGTAKHYESDWGGVASGSSAKPSYDDGKVRDYGTEIGDL